MMMMAGEDKEAGESSGGVRGEEVGTGEAVDGSTGGEGGFILRCLLPSDSSTEGRGIEAIIILSGCGVE